jgi:phosphoribosylglycinamide formyltransferase-1
VTPPAPATARPPALGVLASGAGTILEAILDAGLPVAVMIADRRCAAAELAAARGVHTEVVERDTFGPGFDRVAYTHRVVDVLTRHQVDVVAMAGFGTVLAEPIFSAFGERVLNTHPALLPSFKGWHPVADALAAGVEVTGCTVHVATMDVDAGPVLAQESVPVLAGDTEDSLHERIKAVERRLYPAAIRRFLEGVEGVTTR